MHAALPFGMSSLCRLTTRLAGIELRSTAETVDGMVDEMGDVMDLSQIGAGNFADPKLSIKVSKRLDRWVERMNAGSFKKLIGTVIA